MMTQRPSRDNGGDFANARRKDEPPDENEDRVTSVLAMPVRTSDRNGRPVSGILSGLRTEC